MALAFRIRSVLVSPGVVLAPMEGVTDLTFRRLIRQIGGAGLTCTEFIASEGLRRGEGRILQMAEFDPDENPISIQIYGRRPEAMAEAAQVVESLGATICDINMGCPSKKVCAHSGGSGLLREPALALDIVKAVRRAIRIPLTVKMRTGYDPENRNAPDLAHAFQEEGVEAITIHWRTKVDLYGGVRDVRPIAEARRRLRIPLIANGDVVDLASARQMLDETGADGVMVGRGAIRNPWALRQIAEGLAGLPQTQPTPAERRRVLLGYLDALRPRFASEHGCLGRFKKIANHFTAGLPAGEERLRTPILRSQSIAEAVDHAEGYFAWLEGGGAEAAAQTHS